jgi:septum formation protein
MIKKYDFILASSSPRRKTILKNCGFKFKIKHPKVEELNLKDPIKSALENSTKKAKHISEKNKNTTVLAADTIVIYKGKVLGKPKTKKEALKMLLKLNNAKHEVVTAYAIFKNKKKLFLNYVKTEVYFGNFSKKDYVKYIKTNEAMDKAGSYGIQGKAIKFIKKIKGSYSNVVGLPIYELIKDFEKIGIKI